MAGMISSRGGRSCVLLCKMGSFGFGPSCHSGMGSHFAALLGQLSRSASCVPESWAP